MLTQWLSLEATQCSDTEYLSDILGTGIAWILRIPKNTYPEFTIQVEYDD